MFWLKAKDINEAINRASDKIVSQIDVAEIKKDITNDLKRSIVELILKDLGYERSYDYRAGTQRLNHMVQHELQIHARLIAEEAVRIHKAKVLNALDSKEIQELVEKGIKEKVKDSLK